MFCSNKCRNCSNILIATDLKVSGEDVFITLPNKNLCNNDKICFIIPNTLTIPKEPLKVTFVLNNEEFSYLSKSGNFVYTDQLRVRKLYVGRVKTDTSIILNERCNLCKTFADFRVIPKIEITKINSKATKGSEVK